MLTMLEQGWPSALFTEGRDRKQTCVSYPHEPRLVLFCMSKALFALHSLTAPYPRVLLRC